MTSEQSESHGLVGKVKSFFRTITIEPMILFFVLSFSVTNSSQIMTDLIIDKMCRSETSGINNSTTCDNLSENQEAKDQGKIGVSCTTVRLV